MRKTQIGITIVSLCVIIFSFNATLLRADSFNLETSQKTDEMLSRFDERFLLMDSIIFNSPVVKSEPALLDSTLFDVTDFDRVEEIDRMVEAQISAMKGVTGLDFRGQLYVRPGRQLSYDPDDPLVAYNAKAQAEIEWNIFHSSIYKRASKIKELKLKGELKQLDYAGDELNEAILLQKQLVRFRYYSRLLSIVNLHADNVRLLMETQVYLLEQGKISGEDLLKLINEQTELERQLISIKADSVVAETYAPTTIAYIERADTAGIFESIKANNLELKKLGLRTDILAARRDNVDYVQTMNILPFVRYSYYNRENVHNTYNLDVGVSFKIPVSGEVRRKRKALEAEQDVIEYERRQLETESYKGLVLAFHDLEIYNENILGEYMRMKSLRDFLKMRTQSYYNVDGEYSRINRLQEYNSYLQAWERLLEYSYRRDLVLIQLQSYLLSEPISKYITFKELN